MNIENEIGYSINDSVWSAISSVISNSVNHSVTLNTMTDVVRRVYGLVGFDIVDMLHDEMSAHGINDRQLSLPAT
jgi:hypothetical protein